MLSSLSRLLDRFSEFFAHRKGLISLAGILLVALNFVLQLFPAGWLSQTNFFLHLGIILAIFGLLLARTL